MQKKLLPTLVFLVVMGGLLQLLDLSIPSRKTLQREDPGWDFIQNTSVPSSESRVPSLMEVDVTPQETPSPVPEDKLLELNATRRDGRCPTSPNLKGKLGPLRDWPEWAIDFLEKDHALVGFDPITAASTRGNDTLNSHLGTFMCRNLTSILLARGNKHKLSANSIGRCSSLGDDPYDLKACDLAAGCLMSQDGKCFPDPKDIRNPFTAQPANYERDKVRQDGEIIRSQPRGGHRGTELHCSWQPEDTTDVLTLLPKKILKLAENVSDARDVTSDLSPIEALQIFKLITGASFRSWYDWPTLKARSNTTNQLIKPISSEENFTFSAGHDETKDNVYTVKNFCLSPVQKIGANGTNIYGFTPDGDRPQAEIPDIGTEHTPFAGLQSGKMRVKGKKGLTTNPSDIVHLLVRLGPFFKRAPLLLQQKPTWYVDQKLLFFPVSSWYKHPAWAMQAMGNAVWNIESAFDSNSSSNNNESTRQQGYPISANYARDDVTTVYLSETFQAGKSTKHPSFHATQMSRFSTIATPSHFAMHLLTPDLGQRADLYSVLFSRISKLPNVTREQADRVTTLLLEAGRQPVCFKEAVLYMACHLPNCGRDFNTTSSETKAKSKEKGKSQSPPKQWPIQGYRHPEVQQLVARRFRACAAVEGLGRETPNRERPTVFFTYRNRNRIFVGQQWLSMMLHNWLLAAINRKNNTATSANDVNSTSNDDSSVRVFSGDFNSMSTVDQIAYYSMSDIVFGFFGTGFMYGFLLPPGGSVGVEIRMWAADMGTWTTKFGASDLQHQGINNNTWTDYGSMWRASEGFHVDTLMLGGSTAPGLAVSPSHYHLEKVSMGKRQSGYEYTHMNVSFPFLRGLVETGACLLDKSPASPLSHKKKSELCSKRHPHDEPGSPYLKLPPLERESHMRLVRAARSELKELHNIPSSPRLVALLQKAQLVCSLLNHCSQGSYQHRWALGETTAESEGNPKLYSALVASRSTACATLYRELRVLYRFVDKAVLVALSGAKCDVTKVAKAWTSQLDTEMRSPLRRRFDASRPFSIEVIDDSKKKEKNLSSLPPSLLGGVDVALMDSSVSFEMPLDSNTSGKVVILQHL